MKHNLLKSVILSVILLMGVSNAWAYVTYYLKSDNTTWDTSNNGWGFTHNTTTTTYMANGSGFKLWRTDWGSDGWFGVNNSTLKPGDGGLQFKQYENNVQYNGPSGMVCFHMDQSNNRENSPWVWITRPTFYLKHNWGGGSWTWKALTDNQDGTYQLTDYYGGTTLNYGDNNDNNSNGWASVTATKTGTLNSGNKCIFTFNSADKKINITRLYTIKYDGNGSTTGVPSDHDKKHGTNTALSSSIPTRTGYTFAGWNTKADGSGTNYGKGATYSINADVTLYAKWTAHTYTVKFNANGGTSTMANQSFTYGVEQKLTANSFTRTGYSFNSWNTNTGGTGTKYTNQQSVKNLTSTNNGTVNLYAQWTENKHNVVISTDGNGTTNQTGTKSVGIVGITITATPNIGYAFKQWKVTGGAQVADATSASTKITATAAGTVTAVFEEKPATTIYLEPTNFWNSDNPTYVAHVWRGSTSEDIVMTAVGSAHYSCKVPYGYTNIVFYRKSTDGNNIWNQTNDLTMPTDNKTLYEITSTGTGTTTKADGLWKNATYPITLKSTPYGEFTVKCNNVSHTSSRTKDIVIDLLVGSTIEITQSTSYHNAYNNNLVIKTSNSSAYEAAKLNTTYTICGATTIQENFTTETAHVVYLRVPNSKAAEWNPTGTSNYVYSVNNLNTLNEKTGTVIEMTSATDDEIYKETGYTYYKCSIKAGCHTFRFESKTEKNAGATKQTEYFEHLLPLGQSNCFTINNNNGTTFYGSWDLNSANGDFRVLYVEQQVAHGTDENAWKTVINTTYQHSSDIIKKGNANDRNIVSLHVKRNKALNPEIVLQQMRDGVWVDIERRMVMGPLETNDASLAMLPGRRNAAGELTYDNGIEEIKQDDKEGRVWNFTVEQTDDPNVPARLLFDPVNALDGSNLAPYKGKYYIRTDNAAGGWMTYTLPGNVMTHSDYALEHSGYSHYFCKWVEIAAGTPNTQFVVANDYGANISDKIVADEFTNEDGTLNANANVRWMWNEYTNEGSRAYIAGSDVANFLTVHYASKSKKFNDQGEWIYAIDLTDVQVDDKLTSIEALYDNQTQELLEQTHVNKGGLVMLTSTGVARTGHHIRVIYDFKINQTLIYLIPTGADVSTTLDMIIERVNQDEGGNAIQVRSTITPDPTEGLTVYGVITLTKDHITDPNKSEQEALTYWISFPFDVNIADISGFGEHGKDWILRKYNGAKRAEIGWFLDTKTFWERISEGTLDANTGYVLALHTRMQNQSCPLYDNTDTLKLYFPSNKKITDPISTDLTQTTCSIPEHICTIEKPRDRRDADSNWNLIGVPSFADQTKTTTAENVKYFYDYNFHNDKYDAAKAGNTTFKPMHAYMVQFGGVINWSEFSLTENGAQQLAAKKNASAEDNYELRLELQQNGAKADQTFVELQAEGATEMFDMNIDLAKMFNAGANIYTIIGESKTEAAANVLPIANTVIPVGVQVATAGEYTFAMPDGTDGVVVELIDYEYNTRTNLLFRDYTVNLPAGTNDTRFALSVKPDKTATSMENITTPSDGELRKFIIDGVLYMQKDGVLYDAQGKLVR